MLLATLLRTPRGAAALSLVANISLVAVKLTVGLIMGSISVLSDALDSAMDLLGALVALAAVAYAAKPADRDHPYGHGKIESFSGIIEALLIVVAASFVSFEAIRRLGGDQEIGALGLGIAAISVSLVINIFISSHLRSVARETSSPALEAAAQHRKSDIVTSTGVLVGLILIGTTPWNFLDSAVALGVAAFVAWTGIKLFRRTFQDLLDVRLSDEEEEVVRDILEKYADDFVYFYEMRTRRSGRSRVVDFNLVVPQVMTVAQAHDLTDSIEADVDNSLPGSIVTIHVEPCEIARSECNVDCTISSRPLCYLRRPIPDHEVGPEKPNVQG